MKDAAIALGIQEPGMISYELIMDPDDYQEVYEFIIENEYLAFDIEGTGLDPKTARVRTSQLSNGEFTYVIDHWSAFSFEKLMKIFMDLDETENRCQLIAFWASFESKFADHALREYEYELDIWDIQFMKKSVMGGAGFGLQLMVKQDFGIDLPKEMQVSDWAAPVLRPAQLDYAAYDAYITWYEYVHWKGKMTDGHWRGFRVFNDAIRANTDMEESGLYLYTDIHEKNCKIWERKQKTTLKYFQRFTPPSIIANPNSKPQVSNFLKRELHPDVVEQWPQTAKTKQLSLKRDTCIQAAYNLPYPMNRWLISYVLYTMWSKYVSTYGDKLITKQQLAGKILYRLNMAAALTGRYSSSDINIQNIPRKPYIRAAFGVPPGGELLMLLADYSGIEVRVLAELSGDELLIHDCIYGNVHGEGAALINNIDPDLFMEILDNPKDNNYYRFKELRNRAKVFTFRLTYGAGLGALSISLKTDIPGAARALDKWKERYPKAYNYRNEMFEVMNETGYLPIVDGRTVFVHKNDRTIPIAANYPVQGAAASVMYRACYHTREEFYEHELDAWCAASVHDELLSYSVADQAEIGMECQLRAMRQGWLDIFPNTSTDNLIEHKIGTTWADKP